MFSPLRKLDLQTKLWDFTSLLHFGTMFSLLGEKDITGKNKCFH